MYMCVCEQQRPAIEMCPVHWATGKHLYRPEAVCSLRVVVLLSYNTDIVCVLCGREFSITYYIDSLLTCL